MKRFLVIVNEQKSDAQDVGLQIKEYLEQHECQCMVHKVGGKFTAEGSDVIPKWCRMQNVCWFLAVMAP